MTSSSYYCRRRRGRRRRCCCCCFCEREYCSEEHEENCLERTFLPHQKHTHTHTHTQRERERARVRASKQEYVLSFSVVVVVVAAAAAAAFAVAFAVAVGLFLFGNEVKVYLFLLERKNRLTTEIFLRCLPTTDEFTKIWENAMALLLVFLLLPLRLRRVVKLTSMSTTARSQSSAKTKHLRESQTRRRQRSFFLLF